MELASARPFPLEPLNRPVYLRETDRILLCALLVGSSAGKRRRNRPTNVGQSLFNSQGPVEENDPRQTSLLRPSKRGSEP